MSANPFFSIILPIYNVEAYLDRCIKSIVGQEFKDYEIILVDDGSTDSCPQLCDEYQGVEKFKVVHKVNGGLSSARNAGLEVAEGKYVFFLDSDDYITDTSLQTLYDNLKDNPVDVIKFNYAMQPEGREVHSILKPGLYKGDAIRNEILPMALNSTNSFTLNAWSHIYSMDFLQRTGMLFTSEREVGSEDYMFNFEMLLRIDSLLHIDNVLYNYDYREGSLTKRYRNKLIVQYQKLYQLMSALADKYQVNDKIRNALHRFYLWNCFYVVMGNENVITDTHSEADRVKNLKVVLNQPEYKDVLKKVSLGQESGTRKVYLSVLKLNCFPLINMLLKMK
jgi:glycosyltransferase involved in cell wall biosynthesis